MARGNGHCSRLTGVNSVRAALILLKHIGYHVGSIPLLVPFSLLPLSQNPRPQGWLLFKQSKPLLVAYALGLVLLSNPPLATAQVSEVQEIPYSAYLDLRPALAEAPAQNVPAWIEACEFIPGKDSGVAAAPIDGTARATVPAVLPLTTSSPAFRIRIQPPSRASQELQMRVFFEDRSIQTRPTVTAWDELGTELMRSSPLGQGLGLATSETITIPMSGVNYLEIATVGDGRDVRGVFLTWLGKTQVRQSIDFPHIDKTIEPFKVISATHTRVNDSVLYGVVTASLQLAPMSMTASVPRATIQFELERQPLVAVVSFEVLGANAAAPPGLRINSRALGTANLLLPDLADPGYRGQSRNGENELNFHYTGWIRAQKVIPGQLLLGGLNELDVELSNGADPIAVRSVDIQLKYNWEKLDYVLAPASLTSVR